MRAPQKSACTWASALEVEFDYQWMPLCLPCAAVHARPTQQTLAAPAAAAFLCCHPESQKL
eukprot:scaffold34794_cov17-Tisochrysis_lutea.AAC.1